MKRQRGRNRNKSNNNPNRSLDSNGPDVKIRGNANTIYEKYTTLARDAAASGNRIKAENYRQHAEHYLRLVNKLEATKQAQREEAEQARQARAEENNKDDTQSGEDTDGNSEGRKGRRYPPRVKRDRSAQKSADHNMNSDDVNATNEGAGDVSDKAAKPKKSDTENSDKNEDGKRRRKAPTRKADSDIDAVNAAE